MGWRVPCRWRPSQPATSFPDTYDPIVGALAKLIAAEETGSVKQGLRADDVILLFAGLFQMDPSTDWPAQSERLYSLVLGGLRADATPTSSGPSAGRVASGSGLGGIDRFVRTNGS